MFYSILFLIFPLCSIYYVYEMIMLFYRMRHAIMVIYSFANICLVIRIYLVNHINAIGKPWNVLGIVMLILLAPAKFIYLYFRGDGLIHFRISSYYCNDIFILLIYFTIALSIPLSIIALIQNLIKYHNIIHHNLNSSKFLD